VTKAPGQRGVPRRRDLAAVAIAAFLTTMDSTIVNVALPSIRRDLGLSLATLQWLVTGYLLTFSGLMLAGGRLADRYGRHRILVAGLTVFAMASLVAGTADIAPELVAARLLQGSGAALVLPAGMAIAAAAPDQRARDTGAAVWMAALASALASGPVIGGWLTEYTSWRWIFLVNIPLSLTGLALIARPAPHLGRHARPSRWRRRAQPGRSTGCAQPGGGRAAEPLDVGGIAASVLLLGSACFALTAVPGHGWRSPLVLGAGGLAALGLVWFAGAERRSPHPMFGAGLLGNRVVAASIVTSVLWGVGINGVMFFTSLVLQQVIGFSALHTGLVFLPLAAGTVIAAPAAPLVVTRIGTNLTVAVGMLLVAAGLLGVAQIHLGETAGGLLPWMVLGGIGSGLTVPQMSAALGASPARQAGVVSGLLITAREASGLLGVAIIGVIVTAVTAGARSAGAAAGPAFLSGFAAGLRVAAALAVVAAAVALTLLPRRTVAARRSSASRALGSSGGTATMRRGRARPASRASGAHARSLRPQAQPQAAQRQAP
jgi:MFS family permease